jgi:hypothetical protein
VARVDAGLLAGPVGVAFEHEFVGGGLQPVDGGLGEERVDRAGEPGRQVVFDWVVEAADHPMQRRQPTLGVDSHAPRVQLESRRRLGFVRDGDSAVSTQRSGR